MAYLDRDDIVKLVRKHHKLFKSLASRETFVLDIESEVSKAQLLLLFVRAVTIGAVWWLLSLLNPMCGTLFLLVTAMIQAKSIIDLEFDDISDRVIEVVKSEGILAEVKDCEKCSDECSQAEESEEDKLSEA